MVGHICLPNLSNGAMVATIPEFHSIKSPTANTKEGVSSSHAGNIAVESPEDRYDAQVAKDRATPATSQDINESARRPLPPKSTTPPVEEVPPSAVPQLSSLDATGDSPALVLKSPGAHVRTAPSLADAQQPEKACDVGRTKVGTRLDVSSTEPGEARTHNAGLHNQKGWAILILSDIEAIDLPDSKSVLRGGTQVNCLWLISSTGAILSAASAASDTPFREYG